MDNGTKKNTTVSLQELVEISPQSYLEKLLPSVPRIASPLPPKPSMETRAPSLAYLTPKEGPQDTSLFKSYLQKEPSILLEDYRTSPEKYRGTAAMYGPRLSNALRSLELGEELSEEEIEILNKATVEFFQAPKMKRKVPKLPVRKETAFEDRRAEIESTPEGLYKGASPIQIQENRTIHDRPVDLSIALSDDNPLKKLLTRQ